jgi:hypothetical protein
MKNKDNKKMLVLVLLLVAVIGVVGYGTYSYYFTQGEFSHYTAYYDNYIQITDSFFPRIGSGSTGTGYNEFLGNGGTMELECPEYSSGHERIQCTGSLIIENSGSVAFNLNYDEASASATSSGVDTYAETPTFSWSGGTPSDNGVVVSSGGRATLNISVYVNVGEKETISSSDAQEVFEPVSSGELSASASFKVTATQVH